jgi:hypothetical protein
MPYLVTFDTPPILNNKKETPIIITFFSRKLVYSLQIRRWHGELGMIITISQLIVWLAISEK